MNLTGKVYDIADSALSDIDGRVIAQVRSGPDYLLAYTASNKCGLLAIRPDSLHPIQAQIITAWPKNTSEGSSRIPDGPYLMATSTSATPGTFATVYCGVNSEVIEYSSRLTGSSSRTAGALGPVSVVTSRAGSPLVVSVGSAVIRHEVAAHYAKA